MQGSTVKLGKNLVWLATCTRTLRFLVTWRTPVWGPVYHASAASWVSHFPIGGPFRRAISESSRKVADMCGCGLLQPFRYFAVDHPLSTTSLQSMSPKEILLTRHAWGYAVVWTCSTASHTPRNWDNISPVFFLQPPPPRRSKPGDPRVPARISVSIW